MGEPVVGRAALVTLDWHEHPRRNDEDQRRYVLDYLHSAQEFVEALAADERGMVYLIG